ncbi:MAG TPA: hypothetical protein VKB46_14335 [Pyrinomonadaceae bacterium]|nr:hypothetical protein [Pyrinomonadaceae bacterium]
MKLVVSVAGLLLVTTSGCVVGGGYSSDRGWFLWPGTLWLFLLMVVLLLIFRRRR